MSYNVRDIEGIGPAYDGKLSQAGKRDPIIAH